MAANNSVRSKLLTYALVGRGLEGNKDPIAAMMPFFKPIAEDNRGSNFSADHFKREMFERYDLKLTRDLTEIFVQRLMSLGLLEPVEGRSQLVWVHTQNSGSVSSKETNENLDKILKAAAEFQSERTTLFSIEPGEDDFLDALLSVLLDQNSALQTALNVIPADSGTEAKKPGKQQRSENEYAASEFIGWLREKDESLFTWVADLAGAACVSEALMEIRTPRPNELFRPDVALYLDTPFLMEFLGTSGTAAREDAKFIVDALKSQRMPVFVLPQSILELQRNIKAVLRTLPTQRVGPSAAAILRQEVTEEYLQSVLDDPEYFLEQAEIPILDPHKLPHLNDETHFSSDQEQSLSGELNLYYEGANALAHDVRAITWVMRRRKGERGRDVLRSKHVLLSRNERLSRATGRFARDHCRYGVNDAGPVLLARDLAGLLWLLVGQSDRKQLSKRQLILSCERARSAAPEIVAKMYETLKAINPTNADLLWTAVQKPRYLDLTLDTVISSGGNINVEAADETLARIRDDLVAAERAQFDEEVRKLKDRSEVEANLLKIAGDTLKFENQKLLSEKESLLDQQKNISRSVWQKQRTNAVVGYWLLVASLHLITVAGIFLAAYVGTDLFTQNEWVKFTASSLVSLLSLYLAHLFSPGFVAVKVERHFRRRYLNKLKELRLDESEVAGLIIQDQMLQSKLSAPKLK